MVARVGCYQWDQISLGVIYLDMLCSYRPHVVPSIGVVRSEARQLPE